MAAAPNVLGDPPAAAPAVDPKIAQLEANSNEQSKQINQLKQIAAELAAKAAVPAAAPPKPADAPLSKADQEKQFFNAPLEMIDAMAQRRANEAAQNMAMPAYETQVEQARMLARGSGQEAELFDRFQSEISELVTKNIHPLHHQNVNIWRNAFMTVKGAHLGEIVEAARRAGAAAPAAIQDGPAPGGVASPRPGEKAQGKLSDEEKYVADKMGLSPEEYVQGKALLENTAPGRYETAPDAFSEYMTFDSRKARSKKRATANK